MNTNRKKYTALVTGGTRGIGYAITKKFLEDGINVITTGTKRDADHPRGSQYRQVNFLDDESMNSFITF